jgi:nucleoside-diphosphate-sugar epimerase
VKGTKVLITGGLGFIGSNLAHKLVQMGADVTILDAMLEPYGFNMQNVNDIKDDIRIISGDIRDLKTVADAVKEKNFIFHLAAQVGRSISMNSPVLDLKINCLGTLNILNCCKKYNNSARIVYASSRAVIGEPLYFPVDENHPTNPTDVYGINKLTAEKYCLLYSKTYGIEATSLRLSNVYGPRSQIRNDYYGILNRFIGLTMMDQPLPVFGSGNQTRDYVFIDDVTEAFILAACNKRAVGETFFVGSGVETKFIDMVKMIISVVGKGSYYHRNFPSDLEKIDIKRFVVSYKKINDYLAWSPKTSLADGIKETATYYSKNLRYYV